MPLMTSLNTLAHLKEKILEVLNQTTEHQTLSQELQLQNQDKLLQPLLQWSRIHSKFWSSRLEKIEWTPNNSALEVLAKLPILTRADIQTNFDDLSCEAALKINACSVAKTTGSTGRPLKVLHHDPSYSVRYLAYILLSRAWHPIDTSKSILKFSVRQPDIKRSNWGLPDSLFYPTGPFTNYNCTTRDLDLMYHEVKKLNPGYIISNSSIAEALANYAIKHDLNQTPHIDAIFTTSESVTDQLRKTVWRAFGAKIIDRYSSEEVGWIAIQCRKHNHLHVLTDNVILEIVDESGKPCEPEEPGKVLITALHSIAMPLFRYDVGDIAEWGKPCDCGINLPVLKRVLGKQREFVLTPSGKLRHLALVANEILDAGSILDIRIRYYNDPLVRVEIVTQTLFEPHHEQVLTKKIQDILGFFCPVEFEFKSVISWGDTDKRILFMDMKTKWKVNRKSEG